MNKIILKAIIKKVLIVLYVEALYPLARDYVQSTSNDYDDQALEFLDNLIKNIMAKLN